MYNQRTIKKIVGCNGIGLHTGRNVRLRVLPAPVDSGIIFFRTDLPGHPFVKASVKNVIDTSYATTIGNGNAAVSTIEHLMASFAGLGIDNAYVEVDSPELPIMDGSAAPFVTLLKSGGIEQQESFKRFLKIRRSVKIGNSRSFVRLSPYRESRLSCTIDFDHPVLRKQSFDLKLSDTVFEDELSKAKTFCFLKEVESLKARGFVKGGSLENALVIDDDNILNESGLSYKDEFVRQKMLDLVGDMMLLGMPLIGHISAYKPGHSLNHLVTREILADPKICKIVDLNKVNDVERLLPYVRLPQLIGSSAMA